jgi:DNA-binding SARP family transcriptional activator
LLIYLAVEGGLHSRERLATLLWPDRDGQRARASLRRAISDLQTGLWDGASGIYPSHLVVDHQRIGLRASPELELDVEVIRAAGAVARMPTSVMPSQATDQLRTAASLYRGDLLDEFSVGDAPEFEAWATRQREVCRQRAELIFERLGQELEERGELVEAIDITLRWIGFDVLNEAAYRRLMRPTSPRATEPGLFTCTHGGALSWPKSLAPNRLLKPKRWPAAYGRRR